jgi:VCBS repeat-containing protein
LLLALLIAGSASAATKVQVMTDGVIDVDRLPTISFFQATDPPSPELGQIWWNNATNQLKVAGALGVYEFNATSLVEWDTTPEAFSFTDVTNATISTPYTSDPITVSGINWPAAISVSGDASAKYSVNNATAVSTNGTVASGDSVRAVVTSSASDGTAVNATVVIGGVSDAFVVTTAASASEWAIDDDFSSDSSADYTAIAGTFSVVGGVFDAGGIGSVYHEESLASADQEAQVYSFKSGAATSGVVLRTNGAEGYYVYPSGAFSDRMSVGTFSGSTLSNLSIINFTGGKTWGSGIGHLMYASIVGTTITVKVDWNDDGDFEDTNESDMATVTKTNYSEGNYCGLSFSGAAAYADDFKANGL